MPVKFDSISVALSNVLFGRAAQDRLHWRPYQRGEPISFKNPAAGRRGGLKDPLVMTMVWGLRRTRTDKSKISPATVRKVVMKAYPEGGSIVIQLGWWGRTKEDSARITLEQVRGISDAAFRKRVQALAFTIIDDYAQREVWFDFYRGGRLLAQKRAWYTPPKKRR